MKAVSAEAFRISVISLDADVDLNAFNRRISRIQGKVHLLLKDLNLGKRLKFSLHEEDDHLWLKVSILFSGQRSLFDEASPDNDGRGELARECRAAMERLYAKSEVLEELSSGGDLTSAALDRILTRRGLDNKGISASTLPLGSWGMPLTPMISDPSGWIQDFQLGQNPKVRTSANAFALVVVVEMVGAERALVRVKDAEFGEFERRRRALPMDWSRASAKDFSIPRFLFDAMTSGGRILVAAHIRRHIAGKAVGLYVASRDALSMSAS